MTRPDPNTERNDTLVPEYWRLGEDLQDAILNTGFATDTVEGIAVDVHDLLQAADVIRETLAPEAIQNPSNLEALLFELDHIRWHCESAIAFLKAASDKA